jgi:hypothetical protein
VLTGGPRPTAREAAAQATEVGGSDGILGNSLGEADAIPPRGLKVAPAGGDRLGELFTGAGMDGGGVLECASSGPESPLVRVSASTCRTRAGKSMGRRKKPLAS